MIFQPQAAFRFRISPGIEPVLQSIFMSEVDNATVDLKNKTLTVTVRHSNQPGIFEAVSAALSVPTVRVDLMDGSFDGVNQSYSTVNTKLESHELKLSYADSKSLVHKIVWKFDQLQEWNKPVPEPKDPPVMVKVDGFISPEEAIKAVAEARAEEKADKSE